MPSPITAGPPSRWLIAPQPGPESLFRRASVNIHRPCKICSKPREGISSYCRAHHELASSRGETNALAVHRQALTRAVLDRVDSNFRAIVHEIRKNPDQTTRNALNKIAREHLEDLDELWDFDRSLGTAASHQLLSRKGLGSGTSSAFDDLAEDIATASDELSEALRERGIALYDSETTFIRKKLLAFEESGIDPADFLVRLQDEFAEYERMVAGVKENVKQRAKLTPLDKLGVIAKGVQFLKDLQSTMLLGQFMTAGTEVISTGFNTLLLPALKVAGGGSARRWAKEMSGLWHSTALARSNAWQSLKKGKDITDDFYLKEGSFSRILDHEHLSPASSLMWRVFTLAVDVAQSSTAFFKTARAYGLAYADGLEAALAQGMTKKDAVAAAKDYASRRFDPNGAIIDEDLRIRAAQSAFQQTFDGSTLTGRLGQWVENMRNSQAAFGTAGLAARAALPFFRTLTNIGHNSAQMILPPGVSAAIKRAFPEGTGAAKFLDDFSGKNGQEALQLARGRNRVGAALTLGAFGLTQMDGVEITGPSRGTRWDAKKRSFEEYPASSIIIGNHAVDLTRFLPFSAPLLLAGTLRDYQLEDALRLEGGEYDPSNSTLEYLGTYLTGTFVTLSTLLQDSGASRGVFDLMDAISQAVSEGDLAPLTRYSQSYATQFTPGPLKMAARSGGGTQYEGYTFFDRWRAASGLSTDWERLDFFGNPIEYPTLRGIDPSNRRVLRLDDPAYAEFAFLNKFEGLALVLPQPDKVITSSDWKKLGLQTSSILGTEYPSLATMQTLDGANAWEMYRRHIYEGKPNKDIRKTVPSMGIQVDARKGETFEQATRRIIQSAGYDRANPEFRAEIWKTLHGIYKEEAKEWIKANVMVHPEVFDDSEYGSPIKEPATFEETRNAGLDRAKEVKSTVGNPLNGLLFNPSDDSQSQDNVEPEGNWGAPEVNRRSPMEQLNAIFSINR